MLHELAPTYRNTLTATVKNGAYDAWSTVKHAAGGISDLVKSGAKAIGKAAPIVYPQG